MSDVEFDEMSVEVIRPAEQRERAPSAKAPQRPRELDVDALRCAEERLRELEQRLAAY
jgi:hypothetical protein